MKKITKLLTTFALCGLFTFTNTSGIEENIDNVLTAKSSAPVTDFVSGQWYQLNSEYYNDAEYINGFINKTYQGDFGVNYSYMGGNYYSCYKIEFQGQGWRFYHGNDVTTIYFDSLVYFGEYLSICFSNYAPNSLISYYKYFNLIDNDNYAKVYLSYNLDLITTKFQPLIYLGYQIFDDFFVQYGGFDDPSSYKTLNFFEGEFLSGGSSFVGMKAYYHRYNGLDYSIDGVSSKQVPLDTYGHGLWACTRVAYIRPDLTELATLEMSSFYIDNTAYPSNLVFNEKKYASIQLISYSTSTNVIPNNKALNSFEALLMRPEKVDYGFTDNGNVFVNAFALLGLVYTSLAGFLSFQIFPGLTLGLFLLIPLVVTIIVLIFKVVN